MAQVRRTAVGTVEFTYALEWTQRATVDCTIAADGSLELKTKNVWVLEVRAPLSVSFWDSGGTLLSEATEWIELRSTFRNHGDKRYESVVSTANTPRGAASFSVALASSGLETKRVPLP